MKLFGSIPSPYVRRLRMWLCNTEHDFIDMQIYTGEDRDRLLAVNPTGKIPMLEDGDTIIFDSRVIFRYLTNKLGYPTLNWEQENHLTLIDAANDSFVSMLLLQRSNVDTTGDDLFFKLQRDRIEASLSELDRLVEKGFFNDWHYPSICLFCLIDWIEFRELHDLQGLEQLKAFHQRHHDRIEATATNPR
ncbi:glutathione S-transferase family protein [Alteromonas sediminis]|uniref:glutathione transferase n=1 Tax=Alteromonas sediminis TaxID=2259342 RepID=A0A3N5XYR3_9ALTE|nr:glutathione S-transferase family protein [Alteromonas sediminis]RPJ65770.1 glutathione S-transferase family protein [Alteromonas sediminis]